VNVFVLDYDPKTAAEMHCDKHVVKMILETAQLLSTAHRIVDGTEYLGESRSGRKAKRWRLTGEREVNLYHGTHINHPCSVWCRESSDNYDWLYKLFIALNKEYTHRYRKVHKCMTMAPYLKKLPEHIPVRPMTPFPQAMPDDSKCSDAVEAYRNYYINHKNGFARWTNRAVPSWYSEKVNYADISCS